MSQQSWVCILHVNVNHYFICNCLTFLPTPWNESASEITFSGVQGREINRVPILDVQTLFKERETFQHTNFYSRHPPSVKRGYVKGERYASWEQLSDALRLIKMYRFLNYAWRKEDTKMKFLKNISLKFILLREKGHWKTKKKSYINKWNLL